MSFATLSYLDVYRFDYSNCQGWALTSQKVKFKLFLTNLGT